MKISYIGRPEMNLISERVLKLLEPLKDEFGIHVGLGSGSFTPQDAKIRLEIKTIGDDGEVHDPAKDNFEFLCYRFGLEPNDLGRKFRQRNRVYTITGLNPRRWKMPVNCDRDDGKKFKFSAESVKSYLKVS